MPAKFAAAAGPSIATWPVRSPVAFPAFELAASELEIESIPPIRQSAAFDVRQGQKHFVTRTAPDIDERRTQGAGGLFRIHAERQKPDVSDPILPVAQAIAESVAVFGLLNARLREITGRVEL